MPRKKEYMPIGKNEKFNLYHNSYDTYRVDSKILNNNANRIGLHMVLWNRENIEKELIMLVGDEDGFCYREKTIYTARIPYVNRKLKEIETKF